jgi:hypothetical protein
MFDETFQATRPPYPFMPVQAYSTTLHYLSREPRSRGRDASTCQRAADGGLAAGEYPFDGYWVAVENYASG